MGTIKNIAANAVRPGYFWVMTQKVAQRLVDKRHRGERAAATAWATEEVEDTAEFACRLSPDLWEEAQGFGQRLHQASWAKLADAGVGLSGAGDYALLYFLVRMRSPSTVVETGVAAGFSSAAILQALARNAPGGQLFSSDFPLFRFELPERYVGLVVEDELKKDWKLFLQGDRKNLPKILEKVQAIDFVHYDSDKSYEGRQYAMRMLEKKLQPDALIVMDDIQDNLFFHDYVTGRRLPHRIFYYEGKFVGVVGI